MDNYSKMLIESAFDTISYYEEANNLFDEGYKPFPDEKVKRQQEKMRSDSKYLKNRMKMGMARRRAKEAEKTGVSQHEAGKGWYHGVGAFKGIKEDYFIEMLSILEEAGYLESEEDFLGLAEAAVEMINEISKKTAIKAFAHRATDDFETDDPALTKSGKLKQDETLRRIGKKYGKGAEKEADEAALRTIYGPNHSYNRK